MSTSNSIPGTDGIPAHNDPHTVLALMADVAASAIEQGLTVVHPQEIEVDSTGSVQITVAAERPMRSATSAPEHATGETSPTSLSYTVGAVGVLSALGTVDPAPETPEQHRAWVEGLVDRLETRWAGRWGADQVIDGIARCMAFHPADRPDPQLLMDELLRARVRKRTSTPTSPLTSPTSPLRAALKVPVPEVESRPTPPGVWIALVVGPILALFIGLCAVGIVLERMTDRFQEAARLPAAAPNPAPAATLAPLAPLAASPPAPSLPSLPSPAQGVPDDLRAAATAPAPPPEAEPKAVRRPPAPARPAPREPAPAPAAEPEPEPEPATPARPTAGPGSDLRDPWSK